MEYIFCLRRGRQIINEKEYFIENKKVLFRDICFDENRREFVILSKGGSVFKLIGWGDSL